MTDAFQEDDEARIAYELTVAGSAKCQAAIDDLQAKKRKQTDPIDRRIAIRNDERQRMLDDCRSAYEKLVRDITNAAAADVNALVFERRRLESAVDAGLPAIRSELDRWNAKKFFAAGTYKIARRRTESIRMVDIFMLRCFLRLHPDHPSSADRMIDWLHRRIRPYILNITAENGERLRYRLSFVRGDVTVDFPSNRYPVGRMTYRRTPDDQPEYSYVYAGFRLRVAPWLADASKPPDRFDFGRFVLFTYLTAPRPVLRHFVTDQHRPSEPSWIDQQERKLLQLHTLIPKKRYNAGLLERWLPGLPTVLVGLILEYRD